MASDVFALYQPNILALCVSLVIWWTAVSNRNADRHADLRRVRFFLTRYRFVGQTRSGQAGR
jgi:hypothetical protein